LLKKARLLACYSQTAKSENAEFGVNIERCERIVVNNFIKQSVFCIALLTVTFLTSANSSQAQFYGPVQAARIPDFEAIAAGQQCPVWCWAASVQMVAKSQNVDLPQEIVVRKIFGPSMPCRPSGNIENIVAGIQGVYRRNDGAIVAIQARTFVGNQGYAVPLIQSIRSGRPFIFLTQTHAMVAVGVHWADVMDARGIRTGYVQIVDIELIDPFFTFGAQKYITFPIRPDTAGQISGVIEIQSIRLTAPRRDTNEDSSVRATDDSPRNSGSDDREQAIQECMQERPDACVEVCMESYGHSQFLCRTRFCRPDDPVNIRSWRGLCERRVNRARRP
jgi:hypothetical protein